MKESDGGTSGMPSRKRPRTNSGKLAAKKKPRTIINLSNVEVIAPPETGGTTETIRMPRPRSQEGTAPRPQHANETQSGGTPPSSSTCTLHAAAPELPQHLLEEERKIAPVVVSLGRDMIRVEEKQLMDKLDNMKEEGAVMQHRLDNVRRAEDLEDLKSLPPLVKQECRQVAPGIWDQQECDTPKEWRLQKRMRKQRNRRRIPGSPANIETNASATGAPHDRVGNASSKVTGIGEMQVKKLRQPLPKWLPSDTSSEPQRIFSRPEFVKHVISTIEQKLPPEVLYCPQMWKVRILEEDPVDSNSYLLEAQGQPEHLQLLRQETEMFLQDHIAYYNRQSLLEDDESFIVTATLSIGAGPLGMSLTKKPPGKAPSEGVWVRSFEPDSCIGQLLGGNDAYGKGCVLLSINDTDVTNATAALQVISMAKDGERFSSSGRTKVTLCLSKYADFQNSSDSASLSIRQVSGEAQDPEMHKEALLEQFLREAPPPLPSWIERTKKREEKALTTNFPDGSPRTKKQCKHYFKSIMQDDRSVEVELVMVTTEGGLGAKIYEVPNLGLFLRSISPTKQLGKALGRTACVFGAVLWKFEGEEVLTRQTLDEIIENMGDTSYSVTLVMFDGIDLSAICRERLVRGRWNPRRRNGEPYPLHQPSGAMLVQELLNTERTTSADTSHIKKRKLRLEDEEESEEDKFGWNGDKSHSAALVDTRSEKTGGLDRYKSFERKYKRLARADYKDTKIHVSHVLALLWERHKEIFGSDAFCGESCQCLHALPKLSSNLFKRHIAKQRTSKKSLQTEQELEQRVAGVMKHFAPTFLEKLEKSYPDESSSQLLDRLCDMWSFHNRVPLYGVRCSKKCECQEEWNGLFAQGDPGKMEASWTSRTARKKKSALVAASTLSSNNGSASIPKKKRDVLNASSSIIPLASSANQTNASSNVLRNPVVQIPKRVAAAQSFSFEVALDSSQPLGGYFTTGQIASGFTYVEVESVCPTGQLARFRHICKGTRIEALLTGETKKPVANHTELQDYYDLAKRRKKPLKMIFVNLGMLPETDPEENPWDASGDWTGSMKAEHAGWAGGALDKSVIQKIASTTTAPKETRSAVATEKQTESSQWTAHTSERQLPDLSQYPLKSCLKKDNRKKSTAKKGKESGVKKIKFFEAKNEVIVFDLEHPSNVKVVKKIADSVQVDPQVADKSEEEILFDVIQTGSCKDLIDLLQSGFISSPSVVKSALLPNYSLLKERIRKLDVSTPATSEEKQQLEAKALVMKIFTNCAFLVSKAMTLTRFFELQISLDQLTMEKTMIAKKSSTGSSVCRGQVVVTIGDGKAYTEVLGTLPERQYAEKMIYDDLSFTAHNNSAFGMEDRKLFIEVEENCLHNSLPPSRLGSAIFELDNLEQKCFTDGSSVEVAVPLSSKGGILSHGEAKIAVKKTQVEEEYIRSKRTEVLNALKVQIENIHHFNQQWGQICGAMLSGNIQGIDGLTLLHATVHLGEMPMTKELMDLGADARQRSRLGTPLHFAQQMLEKVCEKEKNLEAKNAPEEARLRQREKCAQARALADMLHNTHPIDEAKIITDNASAPSITSKSNMAVSSVATALTNGLDSIPRGRPPSSSDSSDISHRGHYEGHRPPFQPKLPHLPSVVWVEFPIHGFNACQKNMHVCWHFNQGNCHFWHTVVSPLCSQEMRILPDVTSSLKAQWIRYKQHGRFWTAAYAHVPSKRLFYVQDTIQKGLRSDQGIWWFTSRLDAEAALERTFAIFMQLEKTRRSLNQSIDRMIPPNYRDSTSHRRKLL